AHRPKSAKKLLVMPTCCKTRYILEHHGNRPNCSNYSQYIEDQCIALVAISLGTVLRAHSRKTLTWRTCSKEVEFAALKVQGIHNFRSGDSSNISFPKLYAFMIELVSAACQSVEFHGAK